VDDAVRFMNALVAGLWIALAVAIGVLVLAGLAVVGRSVSTRLERRYLPGVSRWSRRRASLAEDAGPWACPACRSVNAATVPRCYCCGADRAPEARELSEAATDPSVFHRPPPVSRFDPDLYRGPGARLVPVPGDAQDVPATPDVPAPGEPVR
jgi:heme exporter protein D